MFERQFFLAFRRALSISCSSQHILSPRTLRFSTQATDSSESIKDEDDKEEIKHRGRTVDAAESIREDKEEAPRSLCGRIEKLARGDPVGSAFQSWMGDGFPIHRGDIFHTINRLRKRKFNKRALEVTHTRCWCKCLRSMPWMETAFEMVELFAEIGDVENAEKVFGELTKGNYTRYTFVYNALIKCYVKAKICDPNLLKRMILGGSRPDSEMHSLLKVLEQFRR